MSSRNYLTMLPPEQLHKIFYSTGVLGLCWNWIQIKKLSTQTGYGRCCRFGAFFYRSYWMYQRL